MAAPYLRRTAEASSSLGDLLALAQAGEQQALRELIEAVAPNLIRLAGRHGADDPEFVVNGVLMEFSRKLGKFEYSTDAEAFAYLHGRVRSRVIDERRRASRRPSTIPLDQADDHPGRIDSRSDPFELVAQRDELEMALRTLSESQRAVVTSRFLDEMSLDEIAAELDLSYGAVAQLQRRGLANLRKVLLAGWASPRWSDGGYEALGYCCSHSMGGILSRVV